MNLDAHRRDDDEHNQSNSKWAPGGISTDFSKFSKESIKLFEPKLKENQGKFQLKYACLKNKEESQQGHVRDTFDVSWDNDYSDKMRYSKEELIKVHTNCDQQYTTKGNRQFITLLHKTMIQLFPGRTDDPRQGRLKLWESKINLYENYENSHKLLAYVNVELLDGPLC